MPQEGSSVFSLFSLIKLKLASHPLASSYSRVTVSSVFCAQFFSAQVFKEFVMDFFLGITPSLRIPPGCAKSKVRLFITGVVRGMRKCRGHPPVHYTTRSDLNKMRENMCLLVIILSRSKLPSGAKPHWRHLLLAPGCRRPAQPQAIYHTPLRWGCLLGQEWKSTPSTSAWC